MITASLGGVVINRQQVPVQARFHVWMPNSPNTYVHALASITNLPITSQKEALCEASRPTPPALQDTYLTAEEAEDLRRRMEHPEAFPTYAPRAVLTVEASDLFPDAF